MDFLYFGFQNYPYSNSEIITYKENNGIFISKEFMNLIMKYVKWETTTNTSNSINASHLFLFPKMKSPYKFQSLHRSFHPITIALSPNRKRCNSKAHNKFKFLSHKL